MLKTWIFACLMMILPANALAQTLERAVFASGCFWCTQTDFDHIPGVVETTAGYIGGSKANPTYETYVASGHREAVLVVFDADIIPFSKLVDSFWTTFDVRDDEGQFCDRGAAYSSAVYVETETQRKIVQVSKIAAEKLLGERIVTPVLDMVPFWPAEDYHQKYSVKKPLRYSYYRFSCGRNARVEQLWGKNAYRNIEEH